VQKTVPAPASRSRRKSAKKPRTADGFPAKRRDPVAAGGASTSNDPVRFCFSLLDHNGPWPLHTEESEKLREVLEKMAEYERRSWAEVTTSQSYESYGDMSTCPNRDAIHRLTENYEGLDHIGRFRLSGRERLYGVRRGGDFLILWWDPRHEIWPSTKRHT